MKKILFVFCVFCGLIPTMAFSQGDCSKKFARPQSGYRMPNSDTDLFCYLESNLKTWQCLKAEDPANCVHNTVVCMIGQYVREAKQSTSSTHGSRVANRNCRRADSGTFDDEWEQYGTAGADLVPDCVGPRWQKGTGKSHEAFIDMNINKIMNNGAEYIILDPNQGGYPQSTEHICIGYVCDGNKEPCDDGSCGDCSSTTTSSDSKHPMVDTYLEALGDCDS